LLRFCKIEPLVDEIHGRLCGVVAALGFPVGQVELLKPGDAAYRLERDPYNSEFSLVGEWRDPQGMKLGNLLFHADGSFFVEQDIVKPHPCKRGWYVEAVNAWGRGDEIRAEPRLMRMPESL